MTGDAATYSNVLNFPAQVNYEDLIPYGIDDYFADKLVGYSSDVKGLAQAMIAMAKVLMPQANVGVSAKHWTLYADECSQSGSSSSPKNDIVGGFIDIAGTKSSVHWSDSDIKLSSYAYVKFMRDLYGWDDEYKASNWPDFISVEKGGLDAGLAWLGVNEMTPEGLAYELSDPGAGTTALFWTQQQYDKWLSWHKNLAHGTGLPLIETHVPVGNGSNKTNEPFDYQDTFMDWLYGNNSAGNWEGQTLPGKTIEASWNSGNFQKFKEAGFISLWVGAMGWPAVGTHYGARSSNTSKGGPSGQMAGDGGWAIQQFTAQDRSFSGVSIDFNEVDFAQYSGLCEAVEIEEDPIDPTEPVEPNDEVCEE